MATGLIALLDDVAAIAKLAAASIDDVTAAAGKASAKAAGVVVDDTAVTPRYVTGLSPARELPIIGRIAVGSLRNKLLILLPLAMLLSAFAPWLITPLLMAGGIFLCYEGAEKLAEAHAGHSPEPDGAPLSTAALEDQRVSGAIRTDLILSAEIMAIALGEVATEPLLTQAIVLGIVGVLITLAVYGFVALLVKLDDIGVGIWRATQIGWLRAAARWLVRSMPGMMATLSSIGTVAMLWVGGGIVLHGLETFGAGAPAHMIEHAGAAAGRLVPSAFAPATGAVVFALGAALAGLLIGAIAVGIVTLAGRLFRAVAR
jgi:predicted DNA repair protein MutK